MSGESPAVVPFGSNAVELDVDDGVLIPAGTRALIFAGRDGTGHARFIATDATGKILAAFTLAQPSSAAVTAVPQTTTNGTVLLATNALRLGATIQNNITSGFLFIKLGAGASPTDWTVKIAPGFGYELPFPAYTGQITGVWSVAGGGTAQVTEMT
jgi:hypothetical protein